MHVNGGWVPLNDTVSYHYSSSEVWSRTSFSISRFAGDTVQFAFEFESDGNTREQGWFIDEVSVPETTQTGVVPSFSRIVGVPGGIYLDANSSLKVSTKVADTFNVFANAFTWTYPSSSFYLDETADSSRVTASTANSNLDGTGTLAQLLQVGTGINGMWLNSITAKAITNSDEGMIRIFIQREGWSSARLIREIYVPGITKQANVPAFTGTADFRQGLALEVNDRVKVSTQNAETFEITGCGKTWTYSEF